MTDEPKPAVLRVAIDDGLAQIKLIGESPGGLRDLKFPTAIRPAGSGGIIDLQGDIVGVYETEEGERFVYSDVTRAEESRFPDFHVSQIDRVLIRHALLMAGYGGVDVELLTSLPVDEYYRNESRNAERIERKTANLLKSVFPVGSDAPQPRIVGVKVGCQAISAFFDYILDDAGRPVVDIPEAVAVIDIGGSTTDIAVVMNGAHIDGSSTGAIRNGVLDVHRALLARLSRHFDTDLRLSPRAIDLACRNREIKIWGETRPIGGMVDEAVRETGETIVREIDRRIGKGAALDKIILVGGGASLFSAYLGRLRNTVLLQGAEMANARGLMKFARSQD